MLSLNIKIDNIEITDNNTTIITMAPVNNIRWISNPALISAGVAVLPYGVITVADGVDVSGLTVVAVLGGVPYEVALGELMEGAAGDEITLKQPSLALGELTDVTLTSPQDGDALVYDSANSKWVNGAGGGGGGGGDMSLLVGIYKSYAFKDKISNQPTTAQLELEQMQFSGTTAYGAPIPPTNLNMTQPQSGDAINLIVNGVSHVVNDVQKIVIEGGVIQYVIYEENEAPIYALYHDGTALYFVQFEEADTVTLQLEYTSMLPTYSLINLILDVVNNYS